MCGVSVARLVYTGSVRETFRTLRSSESLQVFVQEGVLERGLQDLICR